MAYRIRLLDGAVKGLKKLDRGIARRVTERLQWLGEHYEQVLMVHMVGHRREIYRSH